MTNWFTVPQVCHPNFPALPEDLDCFTVPRLSQIAGLVLLPLGASGPATWTDYDSFASIIDNTSTDDTLAKILLGRGELPEGQDIEVRLGKTFRYIARRRYDLSLTVEVSQAAQYAFLQTLQRKRDFVFWFFTMGGWLLGGPNGIRPEYVRAETTYLGGDTDVETGKIVLTWYSDISPLRSDVPGFLDSGGGGGGGGGGTPISGVMFNQQSFFSQSSATLVYTVNGGELPTTNQDAQILVFQNGQKLDPSVYTVVNNSGPSQSSIIISALVHWAGANYDVIAITTA